MSTSSVVILGQVFLVLIVVAGALLYYLNNLNNELQDAIESFREKLKDEKRHSKGLRIKVQEQIRTIESLQRLLDSEKSKDSDLSKQLEEIAAEYEELQAVLAKLEKSESKLSKKLKDSEQSEELLKETLDSLKSRLNELEDKLEEQNTSVLDNTLMTDVEEVNYEELYHELKNAIAFNMTGGEQVLDVLRSRLLENGNYSESEQLGQLKERYNSIGEMVGVVDDVTIFSDEQADSKTNEEAEAEIDQAEASLEQANKTIKQAEAFTTSNLKENESLEEQINLLTGKLSEALKIKDKLKKDLSITSEQLMAFVAKAKVFHAQKEQIRMHKATQNQMHRNYVGLSNEHKELSRKYRNLEARNKLLQVQAESQNVDPELVNKLEGLRSKLEEKESIMDRLKVENEMLEQQFLKISKESTVADETAQALARLTSEHQLLEQQYLEVLNELDKTE
ncbi:hypothetical protein [Aliikangiella sp. G2MR2-5]|uniref:hypothetical protein n=1 Tax=Aliikangiella sp. G2MR2-5 TaxID=2788943 RepID=UPI0018AC3620|nr:hypothetical protein [Aliikangiella sp. G2MR2-5]